MAATSARLALRPGFRLSPPASAEPLTTPRSTAQAMASTAQLLTCPASEKADR